jgi:hypothetical protein
MEFWLTSSKKFKGFHRSRQCINLLEGTLQSTFWGFPAPSLFPALERRLKHSCQGPVCSTCNIHFTLLAYGTSVQPIPPSMMARPQHGTQSGRRRALPAVPPIRSRLFGQSWRPSLVCRSFIYGSQFASATPSCLRSTRCWRPSYRRRRALTRTSPAQEGRSQTTGATSLASHSKGSGRRL